MRKRPVKPENVVRHRDLLGVGAWALGLILAIGVLWPGTGWFGGLCVQALTFIAGNGALVVPAAFFLLGWVLFAGVHKSATRYQIAGIILSFLVVVSVCQLARTSDLHAFYEILDER